MKHLNAVLYTWFLPALGVGIFFLTCFSFFFFGNDALFEEVWKGYRILLVEKGVPEEDFLPLLERRGIRGIIASSRSMVRFQGYNGMDQVSVAELPLRFEELDPRYDMYMKRLPEYFSSTYAGKEWTVIYVPDEGRQLLFSADVKAAFAGTGIEYILANENRSAEIAACMCFAVLVVFVVLVLKRFKLMTIVFSIPWFLMLLTGGSWAFAPASLLFVALMFSFEELAPLFLERLHYRVPSPKHVGLFAQTWVLCIVCIVMFVRFIVAGAGISGILSLLFPIIACIDLFMLYAWFHTIRKRRSNHRLFFPVQILRANFFHTKVRKLEPFRFVLFLTICVPPLFFSLFFQGQELNIPVPRPYNNVARYSWGTLERLWIERDEDDLPDLSLYLTHTAFQEGFVVNRNFEFPIKGEKLALTSYRRSGERIEQYQTVLDEFDDAWYEAIMAEAGKQGIEKLLLEQGRPVRVVRHRGSVQGSAMLIVQVVLGVFVFAPSLLRTYRMTAQWMYGLKVSYTRRKRQEA